MTDFEIGERVYTASRHQVNRWHVADPNSYKGSIALRADNGIVAGMSIEFVYKSREDAEAYATARRK